ERVARRGGATWAGGRDGAGAGGMGGGGGAEGRGVGGGAGFGQDAGRSYEERQRIPGDYDAQVSIHGGIARHRLEHLASTDRGVTMLRNMVRRGIRAVQSGDDPRHDGTQNGKAVATYGHDRVVSGIPPAATLDEDKRLLREVARGVVTEMIGNAGAL